MTAGFAFLCLSYTLQFYWRVNYHYDASGMRTATQLFSQGSEVITTSQAYDGMGLTQIKHGDIAQYDYSWDAANRITTMNDAVYGYDATSQLTSAVYEKLPEESYQYDANGNRKSYEIGKNNQLLSDGVFDYKYDDGGNRTAKVSKNSRTEYFWDHRNRLVRVVDNGKTVEYDYDYQNRLVRRNDELFLHDGWQIACSLKNGKVEHRYLWGAAQDELLAMDDMWTLRDHLNTVRNVVDAEGKVVSHLEYNAFGVLVSATGDKPLFRYTSKLFDDVTGLQWNVNRWYDSKVGRWISEDPIGFKGKDVNLCRYANNRPVRHADILGLKKTDQEKCDEYIDDTWSFLSKELLKKLLEIDPSNPPYGFVLCHRGKKIACINNLVITILLEIAMNSTFISPSAFGIIKDCVREHEEVHFDHGDCPPCGKSRLEPREPNDHNKNECDAYKQEISCLQNAQEKCWAPEVGDRDLCLETLSKYLRDAEEEAKYYCEKARM